MRVRRIILCAALAALAVVATASGSTNRASLTPNTVNQERGALNRALLHTTYALDSLPQGFYDDAANEMRLVGNALNTAERLASGEPKLAEVMSAVHRAQSDNTTAASFVATGNIKKATIFERRAATDEGTAVLLLDDVLKTKSGTDSCIGSADNIARRYTLVSVDCGNTMNQIRQLIVGGNSMRSGDARPLLATRPINANSGTYETGRAGSPASAKTGTCSFTRGIMHCRIAHTIPSNGFLVLQIAPRLENGTRLLVTAKTSTGDLWPMRVKVRGA